jgi:hypothetical protein
VPLPLFFFLQPKPSLPPVCAAPPVTFPRTPWSQNQTIVPPLSIPLLQWALPVTHLSSPLRIQNRHH